MRIVCAGEGRHGPPLSFVAGAAMLLLALGCAFPAGATPGFYARLDSFNYSEPVSLDAALNDWQGRFRGGDKQWSSQWLEAGYRHHRWSLSALYRRDYWLDFSRDTAELYYRTEHRLPLQAGRRYEVDIKAYGFSARGVRAGWRQRPLPGLSLAWGLSLFNAADLLDGRLRGQATALADNDYAYDVSVDYAYDKDRLFERQAEAPDGQGLSLDLRAVYVPSARITLRATVIDLLGAIRWRDAPYTRATAVSDRQGFDDSGYIIVKPAISGIEGYHARYLQRLEPRLHLAFESILGERLTTSLQYRYQFGQGLFGLGARTPWREGSAGVVAWPGLSALGFELRRHGIAVGITLDEIRRRELRTLWLSVGINTE